jgi:hypothetical protein
MQLENALNENAAHLTRMCVYFDGGCVDHAKFRIKELEKEELFEGIRAKVIDNLATHFVEASKNEKERELAKKSFLVLRNDKDMFFDTLGDVIKQRLEKDK